METSSVFKIFTAETSEQKGNKSESNKQCEHCFDVFINDNADQEK